MKQIRVLSTNLEEIKIIGDNDFRLGFIFAIFHVHVQSSFLWKKIVEQYFLYLLLDKEYNIIRYR